MSNRKVATGPTFWFSVILIIVGVFLLLENLDIFYLNGLWEYWPLILVAVGVYRLLGSGFRDVYASSMIIIIGFIFLLLSLDVVSSHDIWRFWPVILILIGGRIIYNKVILDVEERKKKRTSTSDNRIDHVAIFGRKEKRVTLDNFQGGNITAMFGGVDLYFGNAKLAEGENILDILVTLEALKFMFRKIGRWSPRDSRSSEVIRTAEKIRLVQTLLLIMFWLSRLWYCSADWKLKMHRNFE